ncbi:transposase [Fructilactobacillus ixorae]|uniref:Transposase n=1 Tax=Fructilactobacillus ixorae TaxID=1750535 RepID=A0ABY5C3I2_9LACO|nr:transposase [Fructilactobacillus ixorae]USS93324.1 transposase [Fructilactobacillus ixorae]
MKEYVSNNPKYRQLKSLYKLLFKKVEKLDYQVFKRRRNYQYACLTDTEVVERLLSLSPSLRDAYDFYQDMTQIVTKTHNQQELADLLNSAKHQDQYQNLPEAMKKGRRTLKCHQEEIENSFTYSFSNGPLEGINNKINVINRTAYGHRSFKNFRLRILISFSNNYFSKNYKQKATESFKDSIA